MDGNIIQKLRNQNYQFILHQLNFYKYIAVPMRKRTTEDQLYNRPEEELRYLSMTEDIQEVYYGPDRRNCKYDIQPWKNQNQNPSQSPERRPYAMRPTPSSIKSQKPLQIKFLKTSARVLQPNSCNNSFRVKPAATPTMMSKRNSTTTETKLQSENKPQPRTSVTRRQSKRKNSHCEPMRQRDNREKGGDRDREKEDADEDYATYHSPVNLIVYPMVTENRRKRLFRKMDKFQNFVSVSLRK